MTERFALRRVLRACASRPDACAIGLLLLVPLLVYGRALLPGRVMSPADILLTYPPWSHAFPGLVPGNPALLDVAFFFEPTLVTAVREVKQGRLPLWDPHAFAGAPLLGNPQSALLFPLTALAYVLPLPLALTLMSVLKVPAAGLAMYWLLRALALGAPAALVGALSFMLSGPLVVWLQWPYATTLVFLPLLMALTERLRQRGSPRRIAGLAVATAMAVFAGYPQGALLGLGVSAGWALVRAAGAGGGGFLARYLAGVALGLGLAAIQWLPFLEYLRESAVLAYRLQWRPLLTLPFSSIVAFLMPGFYGSPMTGDFWGPWGFNEIALGAGLLPWLMLPVALVHVLRGPAGAFFLATGGLAGAVAFGAPVLGTLVADLPPLSVVVSLRVVPVLVFSLCALGAIGVDLVGRAHASRIVGIERVVQAGFVLLVVVTFARLATDYATSLRVGVRFGLAQQYVVFLGLLVAAALLVLARLRGRVAGPWWTGGCVALQLAALVPLAATFNPVIRADRLYPSTPAIEHLQRMSREDLGRVLLPAHVAGAYGLFELGGYDPMIPRRIERLIRPEGTLTVLGNLMVDVGTAATSPVVEALVRRVLLAPDGEMNRPGWSLEYDGPDARVYRNDRALPRAVLVRRGRCVPDAEALRQVSRVAIDLRAEVLLADCAAAPSVSSPPGATAVRILRHEPTEVHIDAVTDAPAYLLLTDTWFPGWSARVDGAEQPVLRADYAFRAVRLEPGRHRVELAYRPTSLRLGAMITGLAAIAVVGLLAWGRPR